MLTLKQLSFKLVSLLALGQPKHISELAALDLTYLQQSASEWIFHLPNLTKMHKIGAPPDQAMYSKFMANALLCPVTTLAAYLARTAPFRAAVSALLLSYRAPHKPISAPTVSRWLTTVWPQFLNRIRLIVLLV